MGRINIKNKSGKVLASTEINEGSKRKFTLMKEDYVSIKFSLSSPIVFGLGSYVETTYGRFEICDEQRPSYNTNTGGYDYELRFDAEYWKWKNKIFKFTPEAGGQEASWNLTATLDVQLGVFLRNLKALGYSYNGVDYIFSIDSSVENKAVLMSYDNTNLLDALFLMASKEKWNCDCWITDNVIHFGRCEFGDAVKVEQAVNAEITSSESKGAYATRVYAFGGTKNISQNYRPTDENVVVNGIVQKRLMLPAGTPYIDAYRYHNGEKVYLGQPDYDKGTPMPQEEAIEDVVVLEEVFPKTVGTMYGITTKEYTDKIENQDGTTTEKKWNAYRYKDASLQFSKDYILPGQELSIYFQSGKLNGMVFAVKFNPDGEPEKLKNGSWNTEAQLWEIVRNETYGRPLPDEVLKPADGDKFVLTGFNTKLVGNAMVPEAEQKLKVETEKYVKRTMMDDGTYTATIYPSWIYEDEINRTFGIGQKINLIAPELFKEGRVSRVIGYEFCLDIPYDHPAYTIGESAAYSRIGELEDKVESLTYKGQTYEGNSGSGVYVIRTNDSTPASDSNVFSSLRTLATFLRKDQPDATKHLISLLAGALFGNYSEGVSGAKIDERGKSELADLIVRGRIESPHYNPGMLGSGYMLKYDKDNGRSYMEVDELAVRMKAVFAALEIRKLTYAGGNWVFSAAGAKCTRVEEFSGYYRCFFTAEYGSQRVENEFRVDDQVRYQEGNFALGATPNASNHFGWRKVIALGEDYIDLSKTDCMANSDAPAAGDDLVQLGNRTDAQRQNAIAISAYGEGSPSITQHKGIKSYSLAGTEKTRISPQKNVFTGELHFESGVNVEEQVGSQGEQILEALEQAAENSRFANAIKKDVDAIKNQVDGIIETWFLDPVPTLSNKPAVDWTTDAEKKKHVGDMYYDANGKAYRFSDRGGKYQWETITDSDIIKALEAAKKAQDTADGKRRVFVEIPSSSSVYDIGDLWVNATHGSYKNELLRCKTAKTSGIPFDISHWEKACNYTDDTTANQAAAQADQAKKDAAIAQNNANIAISNANKANGMLADIASDSKLTASEKQQTKKEWHIIVSEKPKNDASADRYGVSKAAYGAAYSALSAYITPLLSSLSTTSNITGNTFRANFKAYYDARTDLLNAVSAKSKQIADTAQEAADAAADKAQQALEQAIENIKFSNAIKKDLDALKNQVDGVIETWFFDPVPTLTNQPAVNWNTTEEKQKHIGDLYYDKNGKAYRFSNRGGTFQWEVLADSDVAKALEAAKKAQDTADGKRRVFVAVPTASNAYDVGDLWANATYGSYVNELLKCKTAKSSGAAFSISHWEKACKYTDDTTANAAAQKAQQAKEAAAVAQNSANKAKQDSILALDKLTEIADDNKFTASEKQQTKKEWDIIVSEKPKNDAAADRYGISKAAYGAAYNSLSAYITPLLATLTATSPVVGTDFRRNFKAYYDARTDLLNAISLKAKELADRAQQEAGQAASKAEQAKADAAAAQSKANSAYSVADAAKNRLDSWAADGSISPVEKHAIKDEVTRIDADKSEILADYNRYAISSPSHFISQHAAYRGMLVSLSAATPETIAIPSGFAAQQKSYYDARTACLNAIAIAAKKYADDTVDVLRTETKASIDALNGKISLKVDSSTFNSLKQQVQTQGSELQLAKDVIKTKVSQSTFDEQREKQNILAACNDANMVTDDPTFARGTNDIIVYNNASSNAVTITRKAGCGVNSSNYYLDIAAAATGAIEPGYGGFTFRYNTKARLRLVCRFSAWLDKGRRFEFATNATGDNSRHFWLTDNQGKGTWADYAYYVECGTGGSFPSTFFFYVTGGNRPVSTWLSYATIHMLSADADFKHRISTAETKITQTANSISLKADKSYVDGINNRLSSAEIALNPDQIWLKVSERVNQVAIDKSKRKTVLIDAMSLDQNIYYPVIIPMTTVVPQYRIKVYRTLNSSLGVPGWSTHGGGFSLMVSWVTNASGWGTIDIKRIVEEAVHWHTNVIPVGSIGQLNNGSIEYIYVRGGSKYYFEIEGATDVGVYLKTGSYTNNGQTVAPQTKVTFPQREQPTREEIKAGIGVTAGGVTVFGKTISLNGVVTFASLASDAQGKINTAQSTATAAQNTANTARSEKITLARLEGTVIDGGHIKTSLIDVDWIFAREITSTKFNLTAGTIGGFVVSGNSLSSTNGAYGESGSRFFLHSRGSGDNGAFLGFRSDNKWVGLGLNCFSSVVGETCLMRLENTKSEASSAHSKTGLYIDVTGAGVYDDSGMGNNAIWIRRGHISGLRRRTKRTNSNPTNLKNEDNIVICVNTYADMVVNLPSNPEDGQEVWMISANEKSVQVRTIDGSNITNPGRRFTDMRWNIYIYDAANKTWWYSFMNR